MNSFSAIDLRHNNYSSHHAVSVWARWAVSGTYFLVTMLGIALELALLVVFIIGFKRFSLQPFYIIAKHLLFANFISLIIQLDAAVPTPLLGSGYVLSAFYRALLVADLGSQIAFYHFVALQALVQALGYFAVYRWSRTRWLASRGNWICAGVWGWCFGLLYFTYYISDYRVGFHAETYYFCSGCKNIATSNRTWIKMQLWHGVLSVAAVGLCALGLVRVNMKKR